MVCHSVRQVECVTESGGFCSMRCGGQRSHSTCRHPRVFWIVCVDDVLVCVVRVVVCSCNRYGSQQGLMSVKLAQAFPSSTVVSVARDFAFVPSQYNLMELLGVSNCILASGRLSRPQLKALNAANDPARFAFIGADIFEDMLQHTESLW